MKKYFLIVLVLFAVACSKNEKKEENKPIQTENLERISIGNEKVNLNYKFEKGDKFKYSLTTKSQNEEIVVADSTMKSKADQTLKYIFDCEVIDVDEDKTAEISLVVSSINFDIDINGQKIHFDSNQKLKDEDKQKFLEYIVIHNTPFRARINQYGEVIEITRVEKMVDKMNSLSPQKQNLTTEQRSALAKQLGESAIRPITQMLFREFPHNEVGKDSSWEKRFPQPLGSMTMENIAKFTVVDFVKINGDKAAKISAQLSAKFSGKKEGTENGITYNFGEPKINGDGTILFDFENGKLIKADTGTKMEITLTMTGKDSLQKTRKTKRTTISTNRNIVELIINN
ncbi:MAG: DUF6263 family protein [Stygiobacter sp.]